MGVCRLLGKFLVFRDSELNSRIIGNVRMPDISHCCQGA